MRLKIVTLVAFCALLSPVAASAQIDEHSAVKALVGEAGGQGYSELTAVAHAIRNRGHLRGVYGLKSKAAEHPSLKTWKRCVMAWREAASEPDPTHGAQFWLSDYDLTHCRPERMAFRFSMTETAHIGNTHFYRSAA